MPTYYISYRGSDSNTGTSKNRPFFSLDKLNSVLNIGDLVCIEEGGTYYGNIKKPLSGKFGQNTVFESYGNSTKPCICGYKIIKNESWLFYNKNIWKVLLTDITNITGDIFNLTNNVGFLRINDSIVGKRKFNINLLTEQWDFFCSEDGNLYVYSNGKPSSTYVSTKIEVSCRNHLISAFDNFRAYNLRLEGTGSHGVSGAGNDVKLIGLDILNCGGSVLPNYGDGTVQYGNGIQFYGGGENLEIRDNYIFGAFDVGFTLQGPLIQKGFEHVIFQGNTIEKCNQSIEFWSEGNKSFIDIKIVGNTCIDAGFGWGYDARPIKNSAVHLLFYQNSSPTKDIIFEENVFCNARKGLYYTPGFDNIPEISSSKNVIILDKNTPIIAGNPKFFIDNYKDFVNVKKLEQDSVFLQHNEVSENKNIDYISQLQKLAALATCNISNLKKSLSITSSKVSSIFDVIQNDNDSTQNYYKNDHFSTKFVDNTDANKWAKLATFTLSGQYERIDTSINYMLFGDSISPRGGSGILNIQIVPSVDFMSVNCEISVNEFTKFAYLFEVTDFVLVKEVSDGVTVVVSLWFNIGKKRYVRLGYKPNMYFSESKSETVIWHNNENLSSIVVGEQTIANVLVFNKGIVSLSNGQKSVVNNILRTSSTPILTMKNPVNVGLTKGYKALCNGNTITVVAYKEDGSININDTSELYYYIP